MSPRNCAVKDCPGKDSEDIRIFTIPKNDVSAWCENLKFNATNINTRIGVCSRHFEKSFLGSKKLKIGARPTLNLGIGNAVAPNIYPTKYNSVRKCCIVGCNATCPPNTMFTFPEDEQRLKDWLLICAIKDQYIHTKYKYICSKHFNPSMVRKTTLTRDAIPKMEAQNWLRNNANINNDIRGLDISSDTLDELENSQERSLNAFISCESEFGKEDDELEFGSEISDMSDGLECKNFCDTCVEDAEDLEDYKKRFLALEEQLQEERARSQAFQIEIEQLKTELAARKNAEKCANK